MDADGDAAPRRLHHHVRQGAAVRHGAPADGGGARRHAATALGPARKTRLAPAQAAAGARRRGRRGWDRGWRGRSADGVRRG